MILKLLLSLSLLCLPGTNRIPRELHFQLAPYQIQALNSTARTKVTVYGRRVGKTTGLRANLAKVALTKPNSKALYVSPTSYLAREQYDFFNFSKDLRPYIARQRTQPTLWIKWVTGATTEFRSGYTPDSLLGGSFDLICVDEAAKFEQEVIDVHLRFMLGDRRGTLILAGVFRGRNWYHKLFQEGQLPNGQQIESWCVPSPQGCAFQGAAGKRELEKMQRDMQATAAAWEQDALCIPSANTAGAFRFLSQCIIPKTTLIGPGRNLVGYDSGKASDPGSIVEMEADTGTITHSEVFPLGMDYPKQVQRVSERAKLRRAFVAVDSTGAGTKDSIVDFVQKEISKWGGMCRGYQFKGNQQEALVTRLDLDMQTGRFLVPATELQLLHQLQAYEYEYTDWGRLIYRAPLGEHDDLVAGSALCCWARAEGFLPPSSGSRLVAG